MMFCASGRDRTADSKFMRLSGQSTSILCDINIIFFLCQNVSLYDNQHTPKYIYQVLVLFFPKILYNLFDLFRNPFYRVTNDRILMHYRKRDTVYEILRKSMIQVHFTSCFNEPLLFRLLSQRSSTVGFSTSVNSAVRLPTVSFIQALDLSIR